MMKALTVYQPHASLIELNEKKYETRSWATSYRGPIAIHAAKKPFSTDSYLDRELYPFAEGLKLPDIHSFDTLPYGCIIAIAELVNVWYIVAHPKILLDPPLVSLEHKRDIKRILIPNNCPMIHRDVQLELF